MSTPEQPATPPLTRKQMRDLRNTGATPVVATVPPVDAANTDAPRADAPVVTPPPAPLPRAAEPVAVAAPPIADSSVDLGVAPLTRRQARQQERIRTASVPVITPDVAAAHAAAVAAVTPDAHADEAAAPTSTDALSDLFGDAAHGEAAEQAAADVVPEPVVEAAADAQTEPEHAWPFASTAPSEVVEADTTAEATADDADDFSAVFTADEDDDQDAGEDVVTAAEPDHTPERTVSPLLGAAVITGDASAPDLPPSFDQLLSRSATGSIGASNALILTSTGDSPIVAPVTATGEVLITGTLNLPEGLGSIGHAPGAADGKEVDAVLVDGELPAHSSPTPIAASSAISTVKSAGEVIQPPTPEKGSKLMMALAVTAGVLALALVGVLILAFVTGVF